MSECEYDTDEVEYGHDDVRGEARDVFLVVIYDIFKAGV